ncbi:MAG: VOC family protein [Maricaulaceae bacterium]
MSGIRLNQITLGATNMAASVLFYEALGLTLIVDSAPRYVRFEFPSPPDGGEPATLSLHSVDENWQAPQDWPLVYFELDDIDRFIADKNLKPLAPAEMKSYAWREADILDPSGNRIRLYTAGDARRFPDWRVT